MEPYVSHDNEMQLRWATPLYLTFTDFLQAIGATADAKTVVISFDGHRDVTFNASPIDPGSLETKLIAQKNGPEYLQHREENFRTVEKEADTLYVQVNSMTDAKDETLAAFGIRLRKLLDGKKKLILDLRLNNGGEASLSGELLKTLIAFDTRGGHSTILISRMTFSAAQTFATRVDEWTGATFVGEATGSSPNHYGNEHPFKLPDSGLRGSISSGLNQPVSARDVRTAITPDIAIPSRSSDYFAGRDPALETALGSESTRAEVPSTSRRRSAQ
jgi:C-terminal processing protease CtpA/Prc